MRNTISQDEMTALPRAHADKLRVMRRAIKPVIGHDYVDNVSGHKVTPGNAPLWEMSIRPNQHLQPLQISRYFVLQREQSSDFEVQSGLIRRAAADIAQAEDAVILLGANATRLLADLHVTFDREELRNQEGLWQQADVGRPILETILAARKALQKQRSIFRILCRGVFGVISRSLYTSWWRRCSRCADLPNFAAPSKRWISLQRRPSRKKGCHVFPCPRNYKPFGADGHLGRSFAVE